MPRGRPATTGPVKATLHVHLDNGEQWAVTVADLERFGLVDSLEAYMRFEDALSKVLRDASLIDRDVTDAKLNPVRYLVETAIRNPHLLNHRDHDGWSSVADLERTLRHSVDGSEQ